MHDLMCAQCSEVGAAATDPPGIKLLRITTRVEGFFLQRFDQRGESLGELQFDTMDDAMWFADSQYPGLSDWQDCPDESSPPSWHHE